MSAAILSHEKFAAAPPAGRAVTAPAVAPSPAGMAPAGDAPPLRRHTPRVEKYGDDIAAFFRAAIPMVFGLGIFVVVGMFRLMGTPFLGVTWLVAAFFAIGRTAKVLFLVSAAIEAALVLMAAVHLLTHMSR